MRLRSRSTAVQCCVNFCDNHENCSYDFKYEESSWPRAPGPGSWALSFVCAGLPSLELPAGRTGAWQRQCQGPSWKTWGSSDMAWPHLWTQGRSCGTPDPLKQWAPAKFPPTWGFLAYSPFYSDVSPIKFFTFSRIWAWSLSARIDPFSYLKCLYIFPEIALLNYFSHPMINSSTTSSEFNDNRPFLCANFLVKPQRGKYNRYPISQDKKRTLPVVSKLIQNRARPCIHKTWVQSTAFQLQTRLQSQTSWKIRYIEGSVVSLCHPFRKTKIRSVSTQLFPRFPDAPKKAERTATCTHFNGVCVQLWSQLGRFPLHLGNVAPEDIAEGPRPLSLHSHAPRSVPSSGLNEKQCFLFKEVQILKEKRGNIFLAKLSLNKF